MESFEGTNLLAGDYKEYVRDQIIQRQYRLGKQNKTANDIDWINGKTAYFRVASSVDIRDTFDEVFGPPSSSISPNTTTFDNSEVYTPFFKRAFNEGQSTTNTVKYYHEINGSRTGDARLEMLDIPSEFKGDGLAKFLVLHGGSEKALSSQTLQKRYGVTNQYTDLASNLSAYGFKNKDWGFVGMPGIEGVDIKSRNMGSLREASISLRVNSADQLMLIDTLYFRLGYSIFLEWGNSSHYDNNGDYKKGADIDYSLLFDFLEPSNEIKKKPMKFLDLIEEKRKSSQGNYDALLGKVKNFTWEFDPAGFFKATLEVISWGDIVESLRIDGWYPDVKSKEQLEAGEDGGKFQGITKDNESALSKFIYEASLPSNIESAGSAFDDPNTAGGIISFDNYRPTKNTLIGFAKKNQRFFGQIIPYYKEITEATDFSETLLYDRSKTNSAGKIISGWGMFGPELTPYYYIRLGDILDFIKEKLLLYSGEEQLEPIIDINTDPDKNYCFNPGTNVSADPSKVMIRRDPPGVAGISIDRWQLMWDASGLSSDVKFDSSGLVYNHAIFEGTMTGRHGSVDVTLEEFDTTFNGQLAGNIMNIYLEKEFLYSTIDNLRDQKTGKFELYRFVKEICNAINDSLGGVNQLDVRIKEDQTLEIYDQVAIPGIKIGNFYPGYKYPAELSLYGIPYQNNTFIDKDSSMRILTSRGGSFVTNFGIKSEITSEMATTISIGAQANNKVVGEDATLFSKWNFGLVDRIYPEKVDSRIKTNTPNDYDVEELEGLTAKMMTLYGNYQFQYLTNDDGFWKSFGKALVSGFNIDDHTIYAFGKMNPNSFDSYVKLQKDYYTALFKYQSKLNQVPSNQIGMIPLNLNLELDGISGMRIYDQLHVDTTFLPEYYDDVLIFIIKGINHKFQGNRWVTTIDTIAQPKVLFLQNSPKFEHSPEQKGDSVFEDNKNGNTEESGNTPSNDIVAEDDGTKQIPNGLGYSQPLAVLTTRDHFSGGRDAHGSGAYGASRSWKAQGHIGIDLYTVPGETVYAAITGIAKSTGAYRNPSPKQKPINTGVKIVGTGDFEGMTVYAFYCKPLSGIIGTEVQSGDAIAVALDMTAPYPGITNHIHFQIGKPSGGNVNAEQFLIDNFVVNGEDRQTNPPPSPSPSPSPSPQPDPSTKAFKTLVTELQKIYTLTDTYGSNGNPLFKPYKGTFNDDEDGAVAALDGWIAKIEIQNLVNTLNKKDLDYFESKFVLLKTYTFGLNASDKVGFAPPSDPSWSVTIDSDF